ncbi:hypothetical protein EST38_g6350 [Candolleomyces aberdarensis]|uniref:Uncharacterized protein n=1 Tax=Candolleomyces aberdarensis TaxID=2316362 RepID=A0A4Q2DI06_9AGAR|nr:hypothetical protein EST38_g6350 [Candolleomyces aberdarensis]
MYDAFTRNRLTESDYDDGKPGQSARRMIVRIVNSLSSKMEIGAPMAALYLLKNPDHYASHEFRVFYWKNYVNHVQNEWKTLIENEDPEDVGYQPTGGDRDDVGLTRLAKHDPVIETIVDANGEENIQMSRAGDRYVGKTTTDDYRFRPEEHEALNLYEWTQCSVKEYDQMACDPDRQYFMVPNFVGPSLPRKDNTDKEDYCCTMLTLFRPWRDAADLKTYDQTWEQAFDTHGFSERQREIMENFNLRYECYDARDDFAAVFKATNEESDESDGERSSKEFEHGTYYEDAMDDDIEFLPGPKATTLELSNIHSRKALQAAGMRLPAKSTHTVLDFRLPRIALHANVNAFAWRQLIKAEKDRLWNQRFASFAAPLSSSAQFGAVKNDAYILPAAYLTKQFVPSFPEWANIIDKIATEFTLNGEQKKAFKIVANHATCIVPNQLLMYLGGMGGTGKTQVPLGPLLR